MRFSILVSFLLFTIVYSANAQNFQPFKNKYKYQFSYTSSNINKIKSSAIYGIEVDSAKVIGSDSVFYFNKRSTNSMILENNFSGNSNNFWGNSMVKKPGGEYLFLITNNTVNDTLILKTQEALDAQWTFKLATVLYTIQYVSYRQETVLTNQTDYVKTFLVENALGFKDSIKISENFGLVYSFPFIDDTNPNSNFNLTYIFNSKFGKNKLNYFEYFNFDTGDILIYSPADDNTAPTDPLNNDVYKVLSKTISSNGDTVTYSFSKCHIDAINSGTYTTTQTHCEMTVTACSVTGTFPYIDLLIFPLPDGYIFYPTIDGFVITLSDPFEDIPTYTFQIGLGLKRYDFNGLPNDNNITYKNTAYIKQSNIDDNCRAVETILATTSKQASS
jgi:hypothetical protein